MNSMRCYPLLRILALFHFFSLGMFRKSNIAGTGFGFVGPRRPRSPSKCLEHIRVVFLAHSFQECIALSSLFDGKQWKLTLATSGYLTGFFSLPRCWYSCRNSGDVSAFSRKIEEITTQTPQVPLTLPRISLAFMLKSHSSQDRRGIRILSIGFSTISARWLLGF